MTVWIVVWVVLMLFWVFGAGWLSYEGAAFNGRRFAAYGLIPWLCVLILGLIVFGALSPGPARF